MALRGINIRDLKKVIDGYHTCYKDLKNNDCLVGQTEKDKTLRVVIDKKQTPALVITAIILDV